MRRYLVKGLQWTIAHIEDKQTEPSTPDEESGSSRRRSALLSMLAAAEARHARVARKRLPVLAAGVRVGVHRGPFACAEAIIVDADYIESRVLLEWTDEQGDRQPRAWVNFEDLSPPNDF